MGSTLCLIMLVRTDGQGLCCFPVYSVYRTQYATHGREVRRWHTVSDKRCTLENYKVPALFCR